ncbi:hypothetical protein PI125_g11762 [Phytophthora idaei]|nr:hypothetical protein PI125_g11762 [Phytophthora idaei]
MSSPDTSPRSPSASPSSPQPTSVVASSSSTEAPESSALADVPATRPNIPDVRLSRQSFQDLLREVNHEVSERVISTLAPQIETAARVSVGMQLGSPVRGNKRIYARFVTARSLQEVADSVVPDSGDESETTSQELARLRSEIHSAQAAQATAEEEIMHRESAQMACSSARRELEQTQREVHRLRERESSVLQELDAFNAQVDAHNELYQRLENRIKSAENESQRLTQYTARQKEIFKATVATNTSQIRRLHQLLSDSDIADDSADTRLKRRNEDLREQVKRLSSANKALRTHVRLEEVDPDVLVLVLESLSTGELNWELLDVSGQTRDILKRLYAMKDSTMSDENFAAGLARIACREGDDLELSQDDRAANARKTSPGTSYAEGQKSNSKHKTKDFASCKRSRDTSNNEPDSSAPPPKHPASGKQSVSRPITKPPAALNARRSRPDSTASSGKPASPASSVRKSTSSGVCKSKSQPQPTKTPQKKSQFETLRSSPTSSQQPVGSSSVSPSAASPVSSAVEVSPRTGRPVRQQAARSSFRSSLQIELESADDREALNLANVVASIPSSDDELEDVPLAKLVVPPIFCPETSPVPQQSSGVASEAQFTRETPVASISLREAVSEVPVSLSFDASELHQSLVSPTTRVVIMTSLMMQSQMPSPRQHWFSPLVTNLKTHSCCPVVGGPSRGASAVSASTSSAPTTTTPRPTPAPASLFSRVHSGGGTLSSTLGSDKQSLRPLVPLPSPVHGPQPFVRFSKQVVKWDQPSMTPPFSLQGAFKCWTQILNCRLPTPVPPVTKIPRCSKLIKAFGSYKNMAAESSAASGACMPLWDRGFRPRLTRFTAGATVGSVQGILAHLPWLWS